MGEVCLFRADASPAIGAGHVMRCLAFAETLQWAGWTCRFATNELASAAAPALMSGGHDVRVMTNQADVATLARDARVAVIDHYGLDAALERAIAAEGARVVVFDDLADRLHASDILLDSSPQRVADDYRGKVPADCRLLLGARYAIVRRMWRQNAAAARQRHAKGEAVRRIVVSMGATDPSNATLRVIRALSGLPKSIEVDALLGSAAPHREAVTAALGAGMRLHVDPENLVSLFADADLAIGAAGSTSFERAILGLPSILIPVADNQRFIVQAFGAAKAAEVLSADALDRPAEFVAQVRQFADDGDKRAEMSQAAARMIDGRGTLRLLAAVAGTYIGANGATIELRAAEPEDEDWLFELQLQPATRRYALDRNLPKPEGHKRWLASTLADPERLLGIVVVTGEPAGMIRLDRISSKPVTFQVSIAIDERKQRLGIGRAALELARGIAPAAEFVATVLPENRASRALFSAAGSRAEGDNRFRRRVA